MQVLPFPGLVRVATGGILAGLLLVACGAPRGREDFDPALDARRAVLPKGPHSTFLSPRPIGQTASGQERPQIAHVRVVDLDADGLIDVLVCDAGRNSLSWIRQTAAGVFAERTIADVLAPGHVEAADMDGDGDLDLVVAVLGGLFPNNARIGAVTILENDGSQHFTPHVAADTLPRVADAQAGDLDGDGDLDLAVAAFGYDQGETLWLRNDGGWRFTPQVLQSLPGAINAAIADVSGDGVADIVALISQEYEEVWAFVNDGRGAFTPRLLWGSTNPDFGSSWLTVVDLDKDGDADLLYSNGDAFDYAPANSRPWHGVQWLENRGPLAFEVHRIADLSGASSPQAADLDGDGDLDVAVVSAYNAWNDPAAQSLVWLENNGQQQFALHDVAADPTHQVTLAVADLDGNGTPDLVTGGMHISPPYDRISRVTLWTNRGGAARP